MKVHIITKCHVIEIPYFFYRAYLKARGLCFNSTRTFRLFFFLNVTCLQGRLGYPDAGVN